MFENKNELEAREEILGIVFVFLFPAEALPSAGIA